MIGVASARDQAGQTYSTAGHAGQEGSRMKTASGPKAAGKAVQRSALAYGDERHIAAG